MPEEDEIADMGDGSLGSGVADGHARQSTEPDTRSLHEPRVRASGGNAAGGRTGGRPPSCRVVPGRPKPMSMASSSARAGRAGSRTVSRGSAARKRRFLPPMVSDFLRNRVKELSGLAIALVAAAFLVAFVSYDPADPSWNTAKEGMANNLLGLAGSHVADLLIQTLGIGAFLVAVLPLFWSWRLMRHQVPDRLPLRIVCLVVGILLLTAGLSPLPAVAGWAERGSLGGAVGSLMLWHIAGIFGVFPSMSAGAWAAAGTGIAGLFLVLFALGLSPMEWRAIGRSVGRLLRLLVVGVWAGLRFILHMTLVFLGHLWHFAWVTLGSLMRPDAGAAAQEPACRGTPPVAPIASVDRFRRGAADVETPARRMPTLDVPGPLPPMVDGDDSDGEDTAAPFEPPPPPAAAAPARSGLFGLRRDKPPAAPPAPPRLDRPRQADLALEAPDHYVLPEIELLTLPDPARRPVALDPAVLERNAAALEGVLADFGVRGQIVKVNPGPVVTLYELEPAPGTKSSRVIGLADDIARSMSAISVRVAVVPGRNVIGIELPNPKREMVLLREVLGSDAMDKASAKLALVLGKDIGGQPVVADLARMPHLLVAGTTGSGKSVAINTMILSLLFRMPPDRVRFILVDPKMLELSIYEDIPHLLAPVVTDPKKAVVALKWAVREMEDRYRAMSKVGVRNIDGYNQRLREAKARGEVLTRRVQTGFDPDTGKPLFEDQPIDLMELPYIVIIVDEMADLMLVAGKDIEALIQRLAQMARAAGLHLIMATQRPSVDVITGTIKANFPTRISFQVTSKIDSRTILSEGGAEQLLGQGDMLYMAGGGRITRVHGPFVSDGEVEAVVRHLKSQGEPSYNDSVLEEREDGGGFDAEVLGGEGGSGDDLYDQAVALVARERKASTSFIQRHLQIGYNRAARLIEKMEQEGVVSTANHVGKREVLVGDQS
jgi:S-DNA-T family DNA segregation ATPase FtsK/SpoIIIE